MINKGHKRVRNNRVRRKLGKSSSQEQALQTVTSVVKKCYILAFKRQYPAFQLLGFKTNKKETLVALVSCATFHDKKG